MIRLAGYPYLLLILLVIMVFDQVAQSDANINVISYQATSNGFLSNSYIIVGEKDVFLLDAQFSKEEAFKVGELIQATEKNLSAIIITHPHPDHYYGLEYLGNKFSSAKISAGPRTLDGVRNTFKYWDSSHGYNMPDEKFQILTNEIQKYDDKEILFKIFKNGESIENTILYIQSSGTLFVGDIASNGVHMWIGENNIENWLNQIEEIRNLGPINRIYPGHGPVGGNQLLGDAEQYLLNFKESINNSQTANEAIMKMKKIYPAYKMPEILEGSVRAIMRSGNMKLQ